MDSRIEKLNNVDAARNSYERQNMENACVQKFSTERKTVVVGMSGGVDSSVAAQILLEQGYNVIGLFMHNWEESDDNGVCSSADDWQDVVAVCGKLNIPHYSVNFSAQYMDNVFNHFLAEFKRGRTPNPDVLCNREIKFAPFLDYALKLGADYVATGHYCDIEHAESKTRLLKAFDVTKDQTYFLNQVAEKRLEQVLFPLGKLAKTEVRQIAEKNGLVTAKKKDSTGICFIGERKFKQFLSTYLPNQQGDIIDTKSIKRGTHSGLMYYTLGQRRGLGIGGNNDVDNSRWYVIAKDLERNVLVVSCGEGEELLSNELYASEVNWIGFAPTSSFRCTAKFRYRQSEQGVQVILTDNGVRVIFDEPQRAVTPGQYVVFYDELACLGGGVIDETVKY